jgi:hypothetical protein
MNGMQLVLQDRISMNPAATTPISTKVAPTKAAVKPVVKAANAAQALESSFWTK